MPRRREVPKREILPDPIYSSQLVAKFINVLMKDGKKSTAQTIIYQALQTIQERTEDDPMKVFKRAVENVKPSVEVKSRRVGGSTYQVPIEVRPSRRTASTKASLKRLASGRLAPGGNQRKVTMERSGSGPTSKPALRTS